jgi:single-stranded DNA-binding protein
MGRLDISHYQSRDGETKTGFDVWADEVQSVSARTLGAETESTEGDTEAAEPALAGASSLSGTSGPNGKNARGTAAGVEAKSEDLEDLPF